MRTRFLAIAAFLTLFLASCGQSDPFEYSKSQLEYQQAQQAAQLAASRAQALEPVQRAAMGAWWVFLAVVPLAMVVIGIDAYVQRRRPLVRPDHNGQLPAPRAMIDSGELAGAMVQALQAYHQTQALAAQRPMVEKLNITVKEPSPAALSASVPALIGAQAEPQALPSGTVDLADLVRDWRPSVESITLAVGPGGQPYRVHARDLCHVALAGATGGGKSNILRLLLAQLTAAGAKVVLADPHYCPVDVESGDDWRSIAQRLHMAPAVKPADIQHLLAWLATDELPQRLERRYHGQPIGAPLFLAIDELPAIVADVKDAPEHLGRLLREGRKAGLFLLSSAQDWLVKSVGGTGAIRDNFRTAFYCGGDAQTARVLLDVRGAVDDGQLGHGLAYLRSRVTPTAELVRVPLASNAAIERLLSPLQPTAAPMQGAVLDMPAATVPAIEMQPVPQAIANASQSHKPERSPEEYRIVSMFAAGHDVASIVKELWPEAKNGARYQQRSTEVQAVLRQAL